MCDGKKKAGALIPAAGFSSRMNAFKPLIKIEGICTVDRVIGEFTSCGIISTVITGHKRVILEGHIGERAVCIYNENFREGMFSSIRKGIEYWSGSDAEGIFLLPADYPLISRYHIELMYEKICANKSIFAVACHNGRKGHPLWIPRPAFNEIVSCSGQGGIKPIIDKYDSAGALIRLDMPDEAVLLDMDTPEAYRYILDFIKSRKNLSRASVIPPEP